MGQRHSTQHRKIVCATRGGEASRRTEDRAIALARESDAELVFLYVVDTAFARGLTGKFDIEIVAKDLREIGKIVLEQARQRAREQGVSARGEIREGVVADEIQRFLERHEDADLLVVGHMSEHLRQHLEPILRSAAGTRLQVLVVEPA